jgi:hypothetical protein
MLCPHSGCPHCSGKKVSVTNSLATVKPSAAALWDWDLNECGPADVVAGSGGKFWFNLPGTGAVLRSLDSFKREAGEDVVRAPSVLLLDASPEVAAQWHPTKNMNKTAEGVLSQSSTKRWWQCHGAIDHVWEASPDQRVGRGSGCPCCSGSQVSVTNSLASLAPEVAALWHPTKNGEVTPANVLSRSGVKRWWQCHGAIDHVWKASPDQRVGMGSGCPCCSGHQVSVTNSLASIMPKVAAQWHPTENGDLTPVDITSQSSIMRWWRCDVDPKHEWEATPNNRVGKGRGCPYCSGRKGTGKRWR